MTEEQGELAHYLFEDLCRQLWKRVDEQLAGHDPDVEETVRNMLTDQIRFWKQRPIK